MATNTRDILAKTADYTVTGAKAAPKTAPSKPKADKPVAASLVALLPAIGQAQIDAVNDEVRTSLVGVEDTILRLGRITDALKVAADRA